MSYFEIKGKPCDEHVSLQSDFMDAGRRKSDGKTNEAHDGCAGAFLVGVRVGVLRPELTQQ